MIQDIFPRVFDNQYKVIEPKDDDYVFIFRGQGKGRTEIALKQDGESFDIPKVSQLGGCVATCEMRYLFSIDHVNCFLAFCPDVKLPEEMIFEKINIFRRTDSNEFALLVTTAFHLYTWYSKNRFCGMCGTKTVHSDKERALVCPECGNMIFPMIAPAVIIGLIKRKGFVEPDGSLCPEDMIMVSRYAGREYKGVALLAGFCEIGETAEQTVVREIMEEVGLKSKNVKYYNTQPWGIDSNLLLGYYAELDGEDKIKIDEEELANAGWTTRGELEKQPTLISLTATMIEAFRNGEI